jgi:hypothetical protein
VDHFEEYRWQEHAVRRGWWKLDAVLAAISICVISAGFEAETGTDRTLAASESGRCATARTGSANTGHAKAEPQPDQACDRPEIARDWMPSPEVGQDGPAAPSS